MLMVNALTGFGAGGGVAGVVIVGSVANLVSSVSAQTHAMGNIDVGLSNTDKNIILMLSGSSGTYTVTSLTVGGVSLTQKFVRRSGGTPDTDTWIFNGDIASISGSQAISVTFSGDMNSAGCSAVVVTGLQSLTATDDANAGTSTGTNPLVLAAFSVESGGIGVAVHSGEGEASSTAWSSMTERADLQTGGDSVDHRHSAAWDLGARSSGDESVTQGSGGDNKSCLAAAFR